MSEAWLSPEFPSSLIEIPSYTIYRCDRKTRGGGIAEYLSSIFKCDPVDTSFIEECGEQSIEQLWLCIKYKNYKVLLGALYKPPTVSYTNLMCLATIGVQFDYAILLGDLNIDFLSQNIDRKFLMDICESFKLTQVINEPTRISRSSSSLIDRELSVLDTGTVEMYNMTDHRLTYCIFHANIFKPAPKMIKFRDFRDFDLELFKADVVHIDWHSLSSDNDINRKFETFNSLLVDIFDIHAPLWCVWIKRPYRPSISDTIKEIIKLKDKAFKKFRKTGNQEHKNVYLDLKNYVFCN